MKTVVIVDYGMGNIDSTVRAVEECGGSAVVSDREEVIKRATHIILPGVGAFPDGMKHLRERSLDVILGEHALDAGIPFLGICLGMQLLATEGHEGQVTDGLAWIPGQVRHLEATTKGERIPHVGWNEVYPEDASPLLRGIEPGKDFYFVHSYHFCCDNDTHVAARTPYCGDFISVVGNDNVFGVQFHPEKSQKTGFQVLRNFLTR